jgi:hypothetical protein
MPRFRARATAPRKNKDWGGCATSIATSGAGTVFAVYCLGPLDLRTQYTDPTVLAHQLVSSWKTGEVAPANSFLAAGAIAWDGDPDTNAVPTETPDPFGDPEADWLIRQVMPVPPGLAAGSIITPSADWLTTSKARRRLGNTRGLLIVGEIVGVSASAAIDYRYLIGE